MVAGVAAPVSWPVACVALGAAVGIAAVAACVTLGAAVGLAVVAGPQAASDMARTDTRLKIIVHLILPNIFTLLFFFGFSRYLFSLSKS